MIARATTPDIIFNFKHFNLEQVEKMELTITQYDHKLVKRENDLEVEGNTIRYTMTQQETLMFDAKADAEVQFRFLVSGKTIPTAIKKIRVDRTLNDEVIVW